ncbi:MAG: hypothetical protein E7576_10365 [Ruminococcaceae bacterium]|nr:hypothetical protein [Oscillospiraceae bacterium]
MDRLKCEFRWLGEHLRAAGLWAFAAAAGCVILWISGGSGWYPLKAMRTPLPSLGLLFALSLLRAGFCGLAGALCSSVGWEGDKQGKTIGTCLRRLFLPSRRSAVGWAAAAYLFGLGWYAVFFCTRMTLFGAVLLVGGILSLIAAGCGVRLGKLSAAVWIGLGPALGIDLFLLILTLLAA